jgi:hypothetical protein
VGSLNVGRAYHSATLLNNGQVLIVGGQDANFNILASAELYDPVAEAFTLTGNLSNARRYHTATLLTGGQVLIAGGIGANCNASAQAVLYDSSGGTFTLTGYLNTPRGEHTATLLNNGTVLLVAGTDFSGDTFFSSEVFDPTTATFTSSVNLNIARFSQTASRLLNGAVLVTGGRDSDFLPEATAELFQPTALTPASLVSITVNPQNPSVSAGIAQNFAATGTLGDGSTQALSSVTWSSSNAGIASITNDDLTNEGRAFAAAAGSTTVSACAGVACGSTILTVTASSLTISDLLPSSGAAGTVVSITGTNFGATQGNSTVTFNGVPANVVTWSSSGIVAVVPSNATTGNVAVNVSGTPSNGVLFTVVPPPSITSVSPSTGAAGTTVTITGVSFGASPGQSVRFNGVEAQVSSWSDISISIVVPANAVTGPVTIITANGLLSNGVTFTVPLVIVSIEPTSGPIGTVIAINGSSFGPTQGSGTVSIGNTPMAVFAWSDTQIVATVVPGTSTGAAEVQQNGNVVSGPIFTVSSTFSPYTVSPQTLNLLVGQSRTVSVTNASGAAVTGLQWTTSDSSVVSLSTDDPPVITAIAPGSATVHAGVVPVAVTVYAGSSLPSGTAPWSLPLTGSSLLNVVPAVPSSSGVDVFTADFSPAGVGTLSAITSDGQIAWQIGTGGEVIPDFSGGVYLYQLASCGANCQTHQVVRIDPVTHNQNSVYTFSTALDLAYSTRILIQWDANRGVRQTA